MLSPIEHRARPNQDALTTAEKQLLGIMADPRKVHEVVLLALKHLKDNQDEIKELIDQYDSTEKKNFLILTIVELLFTNPNFGTYFLNQEIFQRFPEIARSFENGLIQVEYQPAEGQSAESPYCQQAHCAGRNAITAMNRAASTFSLALGLGKLERRFDTLTPQLVKYLKQKAGANNPVSNSSLHASKTPDLGKSVEPVPLSEDDPEIIDKFVGKILAGIDDEPHSIRKCLELAAEAVFLDRISPFYHDPKDDDINIGYAHSLIGVKTPEKNSKYNQDKVRTGRQRARGALSLAREIALNLAKELDNRGKLVRDGDRRRSLNGEVRFLFDQVGRDIVDGLRQRKFNPI